MMMRITKQCAAHDEEAKYPYKVDQELCATVQNAVYEYIYHEDISTDMSWPRGLILDIYGL